VQLARVCGNVVSTIKHPALANRKLLLVELHDLRGRPTDRRSVAVDTVDAGPGDWVLILDEGASASQILANPRGPVRTVVVGIVDAVTAAGFDPAGGGDRTPPLPGDGNLSGRPPAKPAS
jgi:microcompartment protein CcmK/EutM